MCENRGYLKVRVSNVLRADTAIYDRLRANSIDPIAIIGDLNKGSTDDIPTQHPTRPSSGRGMTGAA